MAERNMRKSRTGTVVSDSMDKTVTVLITTHKRDSKYKKYVRRSKKFLAHDEENACAKGDRVRIVETRPLSKRKCWRVAEILEKAK